VTEPLRIGINGFGRIGRTFLRAMWSRWVPGVEVVAINDVIGPDQLAYLFEFDSVFGRWPEPVVLEEGELRVGERAVLLLNAGTPDALPWKALGVRVVIEASRLFGPAEQARRHLDAGAELVIVSAPSAGADATFVVGVNEHQFDPAIHKVVSNASCTTNCLAPMAQVLDDAFGIESALMTTVHAYTSDQSLVDGSRGTLRDSRAAGQNVIPTSTGATRAMGLVLPSLADRFQGSSLRVPVSDGSITDLTVALQTEATRDEVNAAFLGASTGRLAGILDYSDAELVSSDIVGRAASCVLDAPLTKTNGRLAKVFGWYDNEWGYSNRLVDLALRLGGQLLPADELAA
jgi:glyceraldehyde 3-phosphate dehydrogenase